MWLITGGAWQGKLDYARSLTVADPSSICDGATCTREDLLSARVVDHFHLWIRRMLENDTDIQKELEQILAHNPDLVIVADELGCGLVPMDIADRRYRETTGRICCQLAKEAAQVHRVISGIGMVLKHD